MPLWRQACNPKGQKQLISRPSVVICFKRQFSWHGWLKISQNIGQSSGVLEFKQPYLAAFTI
ncbi:MAG: hypothetical protein A2663_04975 [Candidatus Buchananbacteria bacterium RIFCSPHIGHO2_01_FULL_46_12]|uniref:Uncharacterized protein n=2 Tax=Candidatus Buchananiibacteriota TaxID=1817903 RepID=A0A1G1Y6A2_9BACT|nr:MAG: hypothetical protein A2663_04975 [Candidatus Buchananbacteria bacterium RIFCSPHIGHO2_01_FULL_46_12]OGY56393.1 MAG: hypothetical protein A3H67_05185 [Candidatus Buchananbacteria bacterium RIFCSPLOWO2_02_FULL_46_11b]